MQGINLNPIQAGLVAELVQLVGELKKAEKFPNKDIARWHEEMARKAHQLHMDLKAAGMEPRHHRYMIQNRGVPATDAKFYEHIHPVEDLLKFVSDIHANDDPEEMVQDVEFSFRTYSRRWGHDAVYRIRWTPTGWWVGYMAHAGDCDQTGSPYLYENFKQDGINFPADLPRYFAWLWEQIAQRRLTAGEVQRELDRLGRWVSICEQNTPGGIFKGYSGVAVPSEIV